jgi:hypothetical protein
MRTRTILVVGAMALTVAAPLVPAQAGPPKAFSKSMVFVDDTPDPSAYFLGPEHCLGQLPREKPVAVTIPGPGVFDIAISGFTGEWSLLVAEPGGKVVATADADAPRTESTSIRFKKATKIEILPCNLAGTFEAKLVYSYKYKAVPAGL